MLRQATSRLLAVSKRTTTTTTTRASRGFSTAAEVPATTTADSTFIESWRETVPNMEPPKTPSAYMSPRPDTPASIPSKLTVNFVLPYASELSTKEILLAHRYGFKRVILPERNLKDLVDVPATVLSSLETLLEKRMEDVLENAFEGGCPWRQHSKV